MNANELLLWLSANSSGTWSRYRAAVGEMGAASESEEADDSEDSSFSGDLPVHHRMRLNLERLGHAEFFRREFPNGWRVVPPTFACARLDGAEVGTLCGARSDYMLEKISGRVGSFRIEITKQDECPDRIRVIAHSQEQLMQFGDEVGILIQLEAPRMLLGSIPPVDDPQLRTPAEMPFGDDWEVTRFDVRMLEWSKVTAAEARRISTGLFRFHVGFQPQYFLQLAGKTYKLPVQVGKYILLRRARRRIAIYDPTRQTLTFPVSCRPPLLVERALILCAGLVPGFEAGRLVYTNIDKSLAATTKELLRQ